MVSVLPSAEAFLLKLIIKLLNYFDLFPLTNLNITLKNHLAKNKKHLICFLL
ncbi:hypothetical protein PPIS_a2044 [Pseudoalteromonas piscicida]|uniref:Uncharacterized protein n=1 Tax=Pseudoalteromonas piscicida TaxID=43662 RepID=A0ABN5CIR5_PSEO7|nr:hypothetical protein PPIS_a2044 [Pseudoalteromonas piscicida]